MILLSMRKSKIKITELVSPNDVLTEGLSDIHGGSIWKDLLDSLHLCGSGCSTGERKPTTKDNTTDDSSQEHSTEVKNKKNENIWNCSF